MSIRPLFAALLAVTLAPLAVAADADWPREIVSDGTTFVVYEPQLDSLDGDTLLSRSAVSIQRAGDKAPIFGAVETTARLDVDRDRDLARIIDLSVDRVRFPGMRDDSDEARELAAVLEREVPRWNLDLSLSGLKRDLEAQTSTDDLRNTPPKFLYVDQPAILVSIDGTPQLRPVGSTGLERVVNTPFPIVFDRASKRYYFYGSSVWFTSTDLVGGRWSVLTNPPANVAALFTDADADTTTDSPAPTLPADTLRRARIVVATEPTELISTDGPPAMQPLVGSELLTVSNTDSDLFLDVPSQTWYIVVSGRWYKARALTASWSFVEPDQLPASFARIPPSSPKADALAHVTGTEQAKDAVMDAVIPQVAAVDRSQAKFEATYDGPARFESIPDTDLKYAVNTSSQVILADDRYYAVEQGVWFIADSPYGPWQVSETRPVGIDEIPASSPVYNTRYVYIYDVRPDVIYMGYTPGYLWAFPYGGTIVYGTGYYYRPWFGPTYYYPRPWTWGFSLHYSSWYGWSYGMSWNTGWLGLSWNWGGGWGQWYQGYRPGYRGAYRAGYAHGYWNGYWNGVHGGGWFGPGGYRPPRFRPAYDAPSRPNYRPDARPVMGRNGGYSSTRAPQQRWSHNLYARPDNSHLAAVRPSARIGQPLRGTDVRRPQTPRQPGTVIAPQRPGSTQRPGNTQRPGDVQQPGNAQRPGTVQRPGNSPRLRTSPSPSTERPVRATQPSSQDRQTPRPSSRPNDVYTDGNNVYRWHGNQWQTLDQRDVWQPARPSVGDRPIVRVPPQGSTGTQPRVQPRPQAQAQPQTQAQPQIRARPQGQTQLRTQPQPQPRAEPRVQSQPRQQAQPRQEQARPEVRPRDGGSLNSARERRQQRER
ncbi:MAG: hypothetical protein AMXMBFR37_11900 [Steroidobacteraceae bacterium]